MELIRALDRLARPQHGLLHRWQLRESGMSESMTRRWVAAGRLVVVFPSVYRLAGAPVTWEQRLLAAVLAAGEGAMASHHSAARLWDDRALGAARPDGLLEPRMARLLRDKGLPPAGFQHEVRSEGRFVARVDFAYVSLRLALEVDGSTVHRRRVRFRPTCTARTHLWRWAGRCCGSLGRTSSGIQIGWLSRSVAFSGR